MADKYQKSIYNLVHLSKAKMTFDGIYIDSKKLNQDITVLWELYNKYQELVHSSSTEQEQENFDLRQKLNAEEECCAMLEKKVKKLKNLIKILEEKFLIDIIERENDYKVGFEPKIPIVENTSFVGIGLKTRFTQINNEEAKLLKEFLIDESYA